MHKALTRERDMRRREFISSAAAALVASGVAASTEQGRAAGGEVMGTQAGEMRAAQTTGEAAARIPRVTQATMGTMRGEMLYRELGSTGVQVSLIGMGGAHLGRAGVQEDEAIRLIEAGRFPLERMHTHTFGLEEVPRAIETLAGEVPGEDAVHVAIMPGA